MAQPHSIPRKLFLVNYRYGNPGRDPSWVTGELWDTAWEALGCAGSVGYPKKPALSRDALPRLCRECGISQKTSDEQGRTALAVPGMWGIPKKQRRAGTLCPGCAPLQQDAGIAVLGCRQSSRLPPEPPASLWIAAWMLQRPEKKRGAGDAVRKIGRGEGRPRRVTAAFVTHTSPATAGLAPLPIPAVEGGGSS